MRNSTASALLCIRIRSGVWTSNHFSVVFFAKERSLAATRDAGKPAADLVLVFGANNLDVFWVHGIIITSAMTYAIHNLQDCYSRADSIT